MKKVLLGLVVLPLGCMGAKNSKDSKLAESNPLRAQETLNWSMSGEQIQFTCSQAVKDFQSDLHTILADKHPSFQKTVRGLELSLAKFNNLVEPLNFYGYTAMDLQAREAGIACERMSGKVILDTFTRKDLYEILKRVNKKEQQHLSALDAKLLKEFLEQCIDNGLELPQAEKDQLDHWQKELLDLETSFAEALNNDDTTLEFTREQLAGLPEDLLNSLQAGSQAGFVKLTMKYPHYAPAMKYVKDASVRQKILIAYQRRGGEANKNRLKEAIVLRAKIATALGYKHHAEKVLKDRMAKSPEKVSQFLESLISVLAEKNNTDLSRLLAEKRKVLNDPSLSVLEPWDIAYYERLIKERDLQVDTEKVKEYFPLEQTLVGMFHIYEGLLGVLFIEDKQMPRWHDSVRYYNVLDKASEQVIAGFYADLFPREGKYGHAAAFTLQQRYEQAPGKYVKPISAIVANLTPPRQDKPALLEHSEVETLFHEFGHIMHQVLTKTTYRLFSGTNVKRDFVEAPSQMLENWVWEKSALTLLSSHYQTKEKLPNELLQRMLAAKNFNQGISYMRQIFYASIDMAYHSLSVDQSNVDTTELYRSLFTRLTKIPSLQSTWPEASFGHIMGGYDAGYYGYLWSEVFAQDMFTRFKADGILNADTGQAYRRVILENGGEKEPQDLLKEFLGREPNDKAFLEQFKS